MCVTFEEWRPTFNGYYEVSNWGAVRRIKGGSGTRGIGRLLKWQKGKNYPFVAVTTGTSASYQQREIHSLVAEAFLGPRPEGHQVNHKDGDKWNPTLSNLEYTTPSGNAFHASRLGLLRQKPQFTQAQLEVVRDGIINAARQSDLARWLKIPVDRVEKIVNHLRRRERLLDAGAR